VWKVSDGVCFGIKTPVDAGLPEVRLGTESQAVNAVASKDHPIKN